MKKLLLFLTIGLAIASAQSAPSFTTSAGTAAVSTKPCSDSSNVGSMYTLYQDPANGFSGLYVCAQIGAPSLGQGAYGWIGLTSQGTSPTTGTLTVANGKAAVISNSLTFAGTDATTMTFPSTSGTVVTLAATQTLTAKTLTAPVIATISNTGTETLPSSTGGIPIIIACATTTGSAACANTASGATAKVYFGSATLASNTATITLTPGFTGTTTFYCLANDTTTRANVSQAVPASATTVTLTNTTGASDVLSWACFGY